MTSTVKERLALIETQKKAYEKLLPEHIKVDKFTEVALNFFREPSREKSFLKAEINSVLAAIAKAAKDGLLLDGNEAAISFKSVNIGTKENKQYITAGVYLPMVAGIIKLARNSGSIKTIAARMVYENDHFDFWVEDGVQKMIHKPILFGDKGKVRGVYACALLKNGELVFDALDNDEIKKRRDSAETDYIWKNNPEEMAKKSALRKLKKLLDLSSDQKLAEAIETADDNEESETETKVEAQTVEKKEEKPARKRKERTETIPTSTTGTDAKVIGEKPPVAQVAKEEPAQQKQPEPAKEKADDSVLKIAIKGETICLVGEAKKLYLEGKKQAEKSRDDLRNWYAALSKQVRKDFVNQYINELINQSEEKQTAPVVAPEDSDDYEDVPFDADDSQVDDVI